MSMSMSMSMLSSRLIRNFHGQFCRSSIYGVGVRALCSYSLSSVIPLPFSEEPFPPLQSLKPPSKPLWLLVRSGLLDRDPNFNNHYPYSFVSLKDQKIYKLDKAQVPSQRRLPWDRAFFFPDDTEIHSATSSGLVLTVHEDSNKMFLINPLFPSDCVVPLPPLDHSNPNVVGGCVTKIPPWEYFYSGNPRIEIHYIEKSNPIYVHQKNPVYSRYTPFMRPRLAISDSDDFTVALLNHGLLHFWKRGRKSWLRVEEEEEHAYYGCGCQLVYSKSSQCFYVMPATHDLDVWEWSTPEEPPRMRTQLKLSDPVPRLDSDEEARVYERCRSICSPYRYLVESASGDLFLVLKYPGMFEGRIQYYVYRLNFDDAEEKPKWEHVKCLGNGKGSSANSAVVLGTTHGFCVCVDEFPELKPNCIYYIENEPYTELTPFPGDMHVFDMKDNTTEFYSLTSEHAPHPHQRTKLSAVWLFPNAIPFPGCV